MLNKKQKIEQNNNNKEGGMKRRKNNEFTTKYIFHSFTIFKELEILFIDSSERIKPIGAKFANFLANKYGIKTAKRFNEKI